MLLANESLSRAYLDKLITLGLFEAKVTLVGKQIDLKKLGKKPSGLTDPLPLFLQDHFVVVFHYGAVVIFHADAINERAILEAIKPFVVDPIKEFHTETLTISVKDNEKEGIYDDIVHVNTLTFEHLKLISESLAKSITLDLYESTISDSFDKAKPIARNLYSKGSLGHKAEELLKHIGSSLLSEHEMLGRIEVTEKPSLLWEHTHLEDLYSQLSDELEIIERQKILDRKIDLITRTAQTSLDILQHRHSSRLEWYIIILILIALIVDVYSIFIGH